MRLIDADALLNEWNGYLTLMKSIDDGVYPVDFRAVLTVLKTVPTIEVEPVKHGRWINDGGGDWYCSACKAYHTFDAYGDVHPVDDCWYYYCPNCGAKMTGG